MLENNWQDASTGMYCIEDIRKKDFVEFLKCLDPSILQEISGKQFTIIDLTGSIKNYFYNIYYRFKTLLTIIIKITQKKCFVHFQCGINLSIAIWNFYLDAGASIYIKISRP